MESIKSLMFVVREIIVNLVGYKLGVRRLLGRADNNNITWDLDLDLKDKGFKHFNLVEEVIKKQKHNSKRKLFMEMGPGGTLIHGLIQVSRGWEQYYGLDVFPCKVWSDYPETLYEKYLQTLDPGKRGAMNRLIEDSKSGRGPIKYFGEEGMDSKDIKNGTADFIYSWGVFEHIPEPLEAFKRNYEVLKDTGMALHIIDPHPHTWHRFKYPHLFLTISDWLWSLMYEGRGFINRFMPADYVRWAKDAGFKVELYKKDYLEDVAPSRMPYEIDPLRKSLLPRYRDLPDEEFYTHRIYLILTK